MVFKLGVSIQPGVALKRYLPSITSNSFYAVCSGPEKSQPSPSPLCWFRRPEQGEYKHKQGFRGKDKLIGLGIFLFYDKRVDSKILFDAYL